MVAIIISAVAIAISAFAIYVEYRLYKHHSKNLKAISDEMHDVLNFQRNVFSDPFLVKNVANLPKKA